MPQHNLTKWVHVVALNVTAGNSVLRLIWYKTVMLLKSWEVFIALVELKLYSSLRWPVSDCQVLLWYQCVCNNVAETDRYGGQHVVTDGAHSRSSVVCSDEPVRHRFEEIYWEWCCWLEGQSWKVNTCWSYGHSIFRYCRFRKKQLYYYW